MADEFEEIAGEDYVISKEEFVTKHLTAYKNIGDHAFDEWIIDICKLHEHTDKELEKFGVHKASKAFLGGIPEEEMLRRKKNAERDAKKKKAADDKLKHDKEAARLLNELHHLEDDLSTEMHAKDDQLHPKDQGKKKRKNKAYAVDAQIGKLQDDITNMDLMDDE